jgi:hypothetical protein
MRVCHCLQDTPDGFFQGEIRFEQKQHARLVACNVHNLSAAHRWERMHCYSCDLVHDIRAQP